jgi:hypothetical protein
VADQRGAFSATLSVQVIEARDVVAPPSADGTGATAAALASARVQLEVGGQSAKTKTVLGTATPVWNKELSLYERPFSSSYHRRRVAD